MRKLRFRLWHGAVLLVLALLLWPRPVAAGVDWEEVQGITVYRDISTFDSGKVVRNSIEYQLPRGVAAFRAVQDAVTPIRGRFTPRSLWASAEALLTGSSDIPSLEYIELHFVFWDETNEVWDAERLTLYRNGLCRIHPDLVCTVGEDGYQRLAALVESGIFPAGRAVHPSA
ncbi:MAG: hypothetical protein IJC43_06065 [Clostridia bacterium]|nr:hypothetical protein [Clostridia bacterium]